MHEINVTKENDPKIRELLSEVPHTIYDVPSAYSVFSVDAEIPLALVEQIMPLTVESGTRWDWKHVSTQTVGERMRVVGHAFGNNSFEIESPE